MSKFRVGQRVRVKYATTPWGYACVGHEAVVIGLHDGEYEIEVDGVPPPSFVMGWVASADQLEPATDCYDKTEWDACAWKPEHLRVGA